MPHFAEGASNVRDGGSSREEAAESSHLGFEVTVIPDETGAEGEA